MKKMLYVAWGKIVVFDRIFRNKRNTSFKVCAYSSIEGVVQVTLNFVLPAYVKCKTQEDAPRVKVSFLYGYLPFIRMTNFRDTYF